MISNGITLYPAVKIANDISIYLTLSTPPIVKFLEFLKFYREKKFFEIVKFLAV